MTSPPSHPARKAGLNYWLFRWHWISAALSLAGILLFAVTGVTLNHASQIEAKAVVESVDAGLEFALLERLRTAARSESPRLSKGAQRSLEARIGWAFEPERIEWSEDELYFSQPRPGGDAWFSIDLATGELLAERSDRGWLAYFNDLHKGRHSGGVWRWLIDLFALCCVVFCVTGLWLLALQAPRRPSTWPLVSLGVVLPVLVLLIFVH